MKTPTSECRIWYDGDFPPLTGRRLRLVPDTPWWVMSSSGEGKDLGVEAVLDRPKLINA